MFICLIGMLCMGLIAMYAMWKYVFYDAQARGMDAPTWSWISVLSQHSEGFVLYLFKRKKYMRQATPLQESLCLKYKRIFICTFVAMLMCALGAVLRIANLV